jgi:hypothetical protein
MRRGPIFNKYIIRLGNTLIRSRLESEYGCVKSFASLSESQLITCVVTSLD